MNAYICKLYSELKNNYPSTSHNFCILKLAIYDNVLRNEYDKKVDAHNKMVTTNLFADSGFDLFVPKTTNFSSEGDSVFIDMGVKAEMVYCDVSKDDLSTCAFTVHPRSSISKTPLMLANHTGIIDSGYRGSLIGAFRCVKLPQTGVYTVDQNTRLVQICHPTLCPIYVIIVNENDLSTTERNDGGFGSTGV